MVKFFGFLLALVLAGSAHADIPVYGFEIVRSYPHDPQAFTEGLFFKDGFLYESTGLEGHSTVRKVRLETGEVVQGINLPPELFGEGIVEWNGQIIGLTWQTQVGFVLKTDDFSFVKKFSYPGEGWGMTKNATELIQSDGTAELRFIDPATLKEKRRVKVTADGKPVTQLNELEWVEGEVYANIWQTDRIARIDPRTGKVLGWIDLTGILSPMFRGPQTDVLNGIAYDAATKRLFVTGKMWPKLFQIRLVKKK
ncbi:glutaminyl-peptide cyclotransferase [Pelomonas sp. KK5]|uniref:glutaminyl-peptide cyclotransferase n=1 Tax=Pelomonas sp. KK5 TaxID=1855730 RepID=UPI00097C6EAE|nr:glutaminyl-peptide cyclotransferase [Pelomonas sp. KK5]